MANDEDVWAQPATLARTRDTEGGVALPPLENVRPSPRPLREALGEYVAATPQERGAFSLVLENGQAFSADDIDALLRRPDSPFGPATEEP